MYSSYIPPWGGGGGGGGVLLHIGDRVLGIQLILSSHHLCPH